MPQQINRKIIFYIFLFVFLSTFNNKNLSNLVLSTINEIKIEGLEEEENLSLKKSLDTFKIQSLFFLHKKQIIEIISSNNLVEDFYVFKKYPSTLMIELKKTKFLAKTNRNGINFLIGSNGQLIQSDEKIENIPIIYGKFNIEEFLKLKKIIDNSNFNFNKIDSLYFFKSGRWDIKVESGILIKLSKEKIDENLLSAFKILNNENFKDIKFIDLRQKNQIVING